VKFPEISYFLPALKDQRTQRLEFVFRSQTFAGALNAGDNPGVSITVPNDRFFVLTGWGLRFVGGAPGDSVVSAGLLVGEPGAGLAYLGGETIPSSVTPGQFAQHVGQSCEYWFQPGTLVQLVVTSVTAGSHQLRTTLQGFQLPRGNIVVA
jgi:hypothetical protein